MKELRGACIIGQSGGPTSVINASAYGVIDTALKSGAITQVLGAEHGIKGVLADPSRQKKVLVLVQPVRNAVVHQNVESRVQQHYLQHAACGGVLALDVPRVLK